MGAAPTQATIFVMIFLWCQITTFGVSLISPIQPALAVSRDLVLFIGGVSDPDDTS